MKKQAPPATELIPTPVVLVTTTGTDAGPNVITLAWAGVVNSNPPMIGISIRPNRFSYKLLKETGEFCVNIPDAGLVREVDVCGLTSGKTTDKFALTGLIPEEATKVAPPLIRQCPVNLECRVVKSLLLGSHELFIGEILAVHRDGAILDEKNGIASGGFDPLAYCPGMRDYRKVGEKVGWFGFTKGKMS